MDVWYLIRREGKSRRGERVWVECGWVGQSKTFDFT